MNHSLHYQLGVLKMVKCPKCGSKNDKSNTFCLECGTNLKPTLKKF